MTGYDAIGAASFNNLMLYKCFRLWSVSLLNSNKFRLKDPIPGMITVHWMGRLSSGEQKFKWELNFLNYFTPVKSATGSVATTSVIESSWIKPAS